MQSLLIILFFIPLLAFVLSLLFKNHQEKIISGIAISFSGMQMLLAVCLFVYWLLNRRKVLFFHLFSIYKTEGFNFGIDLYFDKLTAAYACVAGIIIFIVSIFSKFYMHRESGFKRFYNHFLLFNVGLNLLIVSGNFETFFLGWEIVGICSFLLISFYRDRYLPVRNAMKVLSFYRMGDVALLAAMWFSHHLFHSNINFSILQNSTLLNEVISQHLAEGITMGLLFVFAAAVKSAQFPFSTWLPRAMEGPTVSSAIFYGSLSVHLGVFLLMRTYPIWESSISIKILIVSIGLITAVVGSFIASVQPTAKTQIAYSSLTQIGIIFIEIAMGWHVLALIHFATNAFLRTYQLLVSPSIMSYLIHEQFFNYDANKKSAFAFLPSKVRTALYVLSVKEWNLDFIWYKYVWKSFKRFGKSFHFLRTIYAEFFFIALVLFAITFYIVYPLKQIQGLGFISWIYAIVAFVLVLISWTERRSALRAWVYLSLCQVFFMLSIIQQYTFTYAQILLYISGVLGAFLVGYWSLKKVINKENNIDLHEFHGHIYEHPRFALLFLISALTISGFPISPTFLGFDILFSHIGTSNRILLILSSFTFVVLELSVLRIYARVFLGQHKKTYHEIAYKSS